MPPSPKQKGHRFGVLWENYDRKLWILAMRGFSLRLASKLTRLIGKRANQILAQGKEDDRRCLLHQNKKDTVSVSFLFWWGKLDSDQRSQ